MSTDAVHILNDSNSKPDDTDCPKRRKLNQSSLKNEVFDILQEVKEFAPDQFNINNEPNRCVSYKTDGTVTKSVKNTVFEKGRHVSDAEMRSSQQCLSEELILDRRRHACEMKFLSLINDWSCDSKLVYGLKHQYSKADFLFENLKTTDKSIGNFLLDIANSSELKVFLALFIKTSVLQYNSFNRSGYELDSLHFQPDIDDECDTSSNYTLKDFVSTDGSRLLTTSHINVNMDNEVILEDCFDDIEPYKQTTEPTGHNGLKISKYYRCAAIVIFPMRYFLQILKKFGSSSMDIDILFMNEVERLENNEKTKRILLTWAEHILSNNHAKSIRMIKAIISLENLAIIQVLFSRCVILNEASILILESACEKYGWTTFTSEIQTMFNKLSKPIAIKLLIKLVIGSGRLHTEKHRICCDILKGILDKCKDELQLDSAWYGQSASLEEKSKKRKEEQDILLWICQLAEKLSFNILSFAKSKSLVVFVPVLLRLVTNNETKLNAYWLDVCQHFLNVMEVETVKPLNIPNWKRDDSISCSCVDCSKLNVFLQSDENSTSMKIGKARRRHIHEQLNSMQNIIHETDRGGVYAVLVVRKTTKTGSNDEENQKFSKTFLDHLQLISPL